jgi:hypothetical protein
MDSAAPIFIDAKMKKRTNKVRSFPSTPFRTGLFIFVEPEPEPHSRLSAPLLLAIPQHGNDQDRRTNNDHLPSPRSTAITEAGNGAVTPLLLAAV